MLRRVTVLSRRRRASIIATMKRREPFMLQGNARFPSLSFSPAMRWLSSCHFHPPNDTPTARSVNEIAKLLPEQAILENFVHHNPLEQLQNMNFKDAIEYTHDLEKFMSPSEEILAMTGVDPRKRAKEAVVDLASVFIDRGAAKWAPPNRDKGFLFFFADLEGLGFAPWRRQAAKQAKSILAELTEKSASHSRLLAEKIIDDTLNEFGVSPEEKTDRLRAMMLEIKGWAGMFRRMETHPHEAPLNCKVSLTELCAVYSILTRSSIEDIAWASGWNKKHKKLSQWIIEKRSNNLNKKLPEKHFHTSSIAYVDQNSDHREMKEDQFENVFVSALQSKPPQLSDIPPIRPMLQLYVCIDDREGSFRRHVENISPQEIETFGVPGFFGVPVVYKSADGREPSILAPEGQNPSAELIEQSKDSSYFLKRKIVGHASRLWEAASFSPMGSLLLSALAPLSVIRLQLMGFHPHLKEQFKSSLQNTLMPKPTTDFQAPYGPEEAAELLAKTFKNIGTQNRFASIVVVMGHGAVSVNNPFGAAYNCGACGGREGAPNARLMSRLANDPQVRQFLTSNHGISIPEDTWFVGGLHNTTNDSLEYFDLDKIPPSSRSNFDQVRKILDTARGENALERCRKFLLAQNVGTPEQALKHVSIRSSDAAEARPELNHATNSAVVIGRRELTKGCNLDRRAFLPSYDPYSDDDKGTNLENVLAPALVVCSGINLEYLFSTIDVDHHGAGTKAPLNVVGNIGVLQGTTGDLRPGLPTQMTEMHTPVRALYIIDAPVKRLQQVLERRDDLRCLVHNDWVKVIVRDPETGIFYRQSNGEYTPFEFVSNMPAAMDSILYGEQFKHAQLITRREELIYRASMIAMLAACAFPIATYGPHAMNPLGPAIAVCGTSLALPVLAFSRRYLHGEFMFGRFAGLSAGLLLGFNLVANAPTLEHALAGWSLFGFCSTFLIGSYNDRITVRNNATFAFAAYRLSDFALLTAATFAPAAIGGFESSAENPELVAAGLITAALFKSSQIPLTTLFMRSMEGPTPASALGYAGLSAHVGIVLLANTLPLWFDFDWARAALAVTGGASAVYGTMISKIRADRKGAIANATTGTIGMLMMALSAGYSNEALLLAYGHAAYRMNQILRSPNVIEDSKKLRSSIGYAPWPQPVSDKLFKLSWMLRRIDADYHGIWMHGLHLMSKPVNKVKELNLSKPQRWILTGGAVTLAGAPFTPVCHEFESVLVDLLPTHPALAAVAMWGQFSVSLALIRFVFLKVLNSNRFNSVRDLDKKS